MKIKSDIRILSCGGRNVEERTLCWFWNLHNKGRTTYSLKCHILGEK
jgi:hypothetical protein